MHNADWRRQGPATQRRTRRRANFPVPARDGISVRIGLGVAHRSRQAIDVGRCELVFGPLGAGMDLADRHSQLVGQIRLPEPVGAEDVHRKALALTGQSEVVALGADEALAFEPLHERQQRPITRPENSLQRGQRARLARGGLAEQVLQGILGLLPVPSQRPVAPKRHQADPGPECIG